MALSPKEVESRRKNSDDISKIIAVVSPDKYASDSEIKKTIKEKIKSDGPYIALGDAKGKADEEHKIIYDSSGETLEPIYFWILDMMNGMFSGKVKKLVDNFSSTAGSGHFSELQGKATRMQDEAMKIMGTIAAVVKGVINLVYDLKDFQTRFSHYDAANSSDPVRARSGLLSLKQIWMDSVDGKRGSTGIKQMAAQFGYATLIDAFIAADSVEGVKDIDLNDRVKNIVHQRLFEFFEWKKLSEVELRKRYAVEKAYLKNQIDSLKTYTRWAKPYLRAAAQLEQKNLDDPALVTAFNTIILQLKLFGRKELDVKDAVYNGKLPSVVGKAKARKYYSCVLVDFYFRGIPEGVQGRVGNSYVMRGRTEVTFRSYTLNDEELKLFDKMLEESDINEALSLADGMTTESVEAIRKDLEYFLGKDLNGDEENKEENKEKKQEKKSFTFNNPFKDFFSSGKKEEKKDVGFGEVKEDNFFEKQIVELATSESKAMCFKLFGTYKKAHGMPSHSNPYD